MGTRPCHHVIRGVLKRGKKAAGVCVFIWCLDWLQQLPVPHNVPCRLCTTWR